ncbi:N-alpha-acetyltransferase 40 isoform X1 [Acipenser oxyrinchus oxyrinchus]|uniref:N-alpha-acetyltransferase 40 isoform X1 n=1 Tax=Acipenser oxyrinchus oxyrinchus TaxID=40147 RepID=A0AAD8FVL0_ACIOX|nr:N-alpha-acetyltransferase 40 isoform X1 [Acipenser oxyrinchus oxyrinchus]
MRIELPPPWAFRSLPAPRGVLLGSPVTRGLVNDLAAVFFQRKSNKAKGKKQKRLEERAAMDAVCARVESANKLDDPLAAFPVFKKYDRNGLNLAIECQRVSMLKPGTVDWAYELTRANMQTLYEQSEWGWKDREKRDEMTDEAWYLTVATLTPPLAFSHFDSTWSAGGGAVLVCVGRYSYYCCY